MGFFDSLGKHLGAKFEELKEARQLAEDVYVNESDDFLMRKFKNGSRIERMAAVKVLRDRGHDVSI